MPGGQSILDRLVSCVAAVSDDDRKHVRAAYRRISVATEKRYVTIADQWRREGRIELLLEQMERRFGPLPPAVEERLQEATIDDLQRWALRILTAPTIDDLFA